MKRNQVILAVLIAAGSFASVTALAQTAAAGNSPSPLAGVEEPRLPVTNRISMSARFGFNISAKFTGVSPIVIPPNSRTTPDGSAYNYDNGYVLPDVSGSGDGYTWNWGYDDSGSQVNAGANTILLSRSASAATLRTPSYDDDPLPGAEILYTHQCATNEHFRFGYEAAANYLSIGIKASSPYSLHAPGVTDAFPYYAGTTPPGATPGSPYQGTFNGPGFVIGTTPVSSTATDVTVGTVSGSREVDADLWGARIGPYLEYYLDGDETFSLGLSGGFALGYLNAKASWNDNVSFTGGGGFNDSGNGSDSSFRVGFYAGLNAFWRLSEHWGAVGGVQYQDLGTYSHSFGTRTVELDLSKSYFISLGISYSW